MGLAELAGGGPAGGADQTSGVPGSYLGFDFGGTAIGGRAQAAAAAAAAQAAAAAEQDSKIMLQIRQRPWIEMREGEIETDTGGMLTGEEGISQTGEEGTSQTTETGTNQTDGVDDTAEAGTDQTGDTAIQLKLQTLLIQQAMMV